MQLNPYMSDDMLNLAIPLVARDLQATATDSWVIWSRQGGSRQILAVDPSRQGRQPFELHTTLLTEIRT
jgi:hypothetical protein